MNEAEIVYLEVDAEITEAIDKLKSAKGDAVKIVVPARSSLLQSAVNLKLLKKSAKDNGKELALVTNDKTATYLAAGVGLAVAATVKAKPEVPEAIEREVSPDIVEQNPDQATESTSKSSGPSGSKDSGDSGDNSKSTSSKKAPSEIEEAVVTKRALEEGGEEDGLEPGKKPSKSKVPNYNAFQKKVWIGAAGVMAAIAIIIIAMILPTVKLTVVAKADPLAINSNVILDSSATENDAASLTFGAKKLTLQKDLSQNFTATGKKDVGTKATGGVTVYNCSNSDAFTVPAGTTLTANGKAFVLDAAASVPGAKFSGGACTKAGTVASTVTASANGDAYNLGNATFAVVGYDAKVSAKGSTSGGTSKTVTVVTQADIDTAKQQAIDGAASKSKDELFAKAAKTDQVFDDTLTTNVDSVSSSAPVDSENSNGTVTVKVTYSVLTATEKTVNEMLDTLAKDAMPKKDQQLYQNGKDDAKYTLGKVISDTKTQIGVSTTAYYGQKMDLGEIAKQVAGKPKKNVTTIVQGENPSVVSTQVDSTLPLPNMPFISSRIKVVIRVNTQ